MGKTRQKESTRIMKWLRGEVMRDCKLHHPDVYRYRLRLWLRLYREAKRREREA